MTDTRIPIPPEVVEAFRAATPGWHWAWNTEPPLSAAIAAMLAAWPGAWEWPDTAEGRALVLPLPQEARDE